MTPAWIGYDVNQVASYTASAAARSTPNGDVPLSEGRCLPRAQ